VKAKERREQQRLEAARQKAVDMFLLTEEEKEKRDRKQRDKQRALERRRAQQEDEFN
jgi:hypothetical protein